MYLSRVKIDTNNRLKMKKLNHLGDYHSWIEDSFPNEKEMGIRTRKLWRIDTLNYNVYLLLLSEKLPVKEKIEKFAITNSLESKEYSTFINSIEEHRSYHFKLTANPTKSVKDTKDINQRGRVIPIVSVDNQIQYLKDRSEKNGFQLHENDFTVIERGFKLLYREKKPLKIVSATYQGILTVTDKELFKRTLLYGIGSKKAYGFGMMTVIPVD